ncbi:hypothetical protein ACLWBD_11820 [Bdellovibrio sp. HCB117]|uniref:hypothetical protein n=1 Tax=Bdellovibrio sp. HCB117 TaxID=3394359 RepID=UPI0039B58CF3
MRYVYGITLSLLLFSSPGKANSPIAVKAVVIEDVLEDYKNFLNGRNPLSIKDFSGPYSRRDVIELILFQQALTEGGLHTPVILIPMPTYQRAIAELEKGYADATANPVWETDLPEASTWKSISTVDAGQFVAGLYGKPKKIAELSNLPISELKRKSITTSYVWDSDVQALKKAGFSNIVDGGNWERMIRMVKYDRVDLLLSSFRPEKDLSFQIQDTKYIPLSGYKIVLEGRRVWGVSKASKNSKSVIAALHAGVPLLKQKGVIEKAYRQSGFFNPQVDHWKVINDVKSLK